MTEDDKLRCKGAIADRYVQIIANLQAAREQWAEAARKASLAAELFDKDPAQLVEAPTYPLPAEMQAMLDQFHGLLQDRQELEQKMIDLGLGALVIKRRPS